jgi:hypothetical protein
VKELIIPKIADGYITMLVLVFNIGVSYEQGLVGEVAVVINCLNH